MDHVLEGAGVVQRQAGVLGESEEHMLVAGRVRPVRIARGDPEAADDLAALEHGRRHPGAEALLRPGVRKRAHDRLRVLVDHDDAAVGHGLRSEPRRARAVPRRDEFLTEPQRCGYLSAAAARVA
jgi:hypothetical protein